MQYVIDYTIIVEVSCKHKLYYTLTKTATKLFTKEF